MNPIDRMTDVSIIGDLHGYIDDYLRLLREDGLIDGNDDWQGGDRQLWLIGDIFDRGPSGIDCLELTMRLQEQAANSGGYVQSLLGNHEMMLLCAFRMAQLSEDIGRDVKSQWRNWGGVEEDLARMTERHAAWLAELPALVLLGDYLLMHSDSLIYITLGRNIQSVNNEFKRVLQSTDLEEWIERLTAFSDRRAFSGLELTGAQRARSVLKYFGGTQIIHGHTPISSASRIAPEDVITAYSYASDLCVNVDGGIYLGGPGFVHRIQVPSAALQMVS